MKSNLYSDHPSTSIPFNFTYPCRPPELPCFLLLFKSNFHTFMVIILSVLMVILLSCLISDLQRSSTYCYRYTAIQSFTEPRKGHKTVFLAFFILFPQDYHITTTHYHKLTTHYHKLESRSQKLARFFPQDSKSFPQLRKSSGLIQCYSVYMWHLRENQDNGYKEGVVNDKTMQSTV